jgi:LmeA-like phospholipid-binding
MSSDSNQPAQPPARRSTEPPDEPAPPTVRMPVQPAGQNPPAGGWQEPATRPAPQWQPTPPANTPPVKTPPANTPPANTPPANTPQPQWHPTVREPGLDPTVMQPAQWQQPPQDTPRSAPPAGQWGAPQQQPPAGGQWGPPSPPPRLRRTGRQRRTRRWVMATFTVVVLLVLLVIGDRVACAITENAFASQFQSQGVPVKPSVNIEGFPFLTQLAAKDFNKIDISASNIPVNLPTGGTLSITSVHATVNGLHISGYSTSANAKVDHISATAFISFGSLAAAGSLGGTGVTLTQAGPNTVKITAGVAGLSDTEEAQIIQTGPQTISIKILSNGGGLGGLLGSIGFNSFSFTLPKVVPASLRITALTLNSQGLTVSAAASNAVFDQGK